MPDITKCKGHCCPRKEKCYRFVCASSEYWQSIIKTFIKEDGSCDFFEPIEGRKKTEK